MRSRAVVYAPQALDDLRAHYERIADAASPETALRWTERVQAFCQRLETGAERGTLRTDVRPGLRAIGFERSATVAFAVLDDRVVILRIFRAGRDWERAFD